MRFPTVAAAVCLGLYSVASGLAAAPQAHIADIPATPAPATAAPTAPAPATQAPATAKPSPTAPAAAPSGDAAAKHAKRTACLKEAKARKLVGADKTSFLQGCIAAP